VAARRFGDPRPYEIRSAPRLGRGIKIGSLCIMVCRSSSADAQESGIADRAMR
jgi:hypothetical protein